MLGVFVSLDLFLFFVFWEAMLIPMYLIIGVWGGPQPRLRRREVHPLHDGRLGPHAGRDPGPLLSARRAPPGSTPSTSRPSRASCCRRGSAQNLMFLAFALAFAIKVPLFPFHTWLPDAHVEAPTAGSVILAGVLLKMGTYGFLRFCLPLFPDATYEFAPLVFALAVIGIVYGALGLHRAARPQEARGLFEREPPGLRDARPVHAEPAGAGGRRHPDGQPRASPPAPCSCWSA